MASFDETPDKPKGFKVLWFAVKAADPASVLDALEFGERTPANWASGLATVYGDQWVFASPPVSGWILVVGLPLPYPTNETHHDIGKRFDVLFSRLMQRFDDVPSDAVDRIFKIVGEQQDETDALVASGLSRREALTRVRQNGRGDFPSETDVVELAALWSLDPSRLEQQDHPVGLGLVARLPNDLMQ
jgi:hypothetical protein